MRQPLLPVTTTLKHARRSKWGLTALGKLSAEQSHLERVTGFGRDG